MSPDSNPTVAPASEPPWLATAQRAGLWLIALVGAVFVLRAYSDFVFEDAYITYRYAKNLSEGLGFVFQAGERVLGTMPLYTLLLGLGAWLGADLPTLAGLIFAGSVAAIAILGGTLLRRLGSPNAALLFATACVCGFSQTFRFWGLETPMLTALILGAVLAAQSRRETLAGVLAALAFLTRYDAALFAILLFLALAWRNRRVPWVPGLVASAIALPWLVFARLYFGEWTPNTLAAKTGEIAFATYLERSVTILATEAWEPLQHLAEGFLFAPAALWIANGFVAIGVLLALFFLRRRDPPFLLLVAYPFALWLGYAWIGPPLEFRWYLVPAAFLLLLSALIGWGLALARVRLSKTRFLAAAVLVASAMLVQPRALARQSDQLSGDETYRSRIVAYADLSQWVVENDLTDLTLLTLEPGYFTYHSGNPVIDGAGLVTKGVYFFGNQHPRTEFSELVDRLHPPLIVGMFPYRPPAYVLVQSAFPFMQLYLSSEKHRELFASFSQRHMRADPASIPGLLKHPFELDVERSSRKTWSAQGGDVRYVGRPFELSIDGAPVTDDYLFLSSFLTGAETPPFLVDFDRLVFRFAAKSPDLMPYDETVAQLVIDGRVVLQEPGRHDRRNHDFPLASWPVRPWRGKVAQLRFVQMSVKGKWLAADHIRSVVDEHAVRIDDFDGADGFGDRWKSLTLAQPTEMTELAARYGIEFMPSGRAATSYAVAGTHNLESKPFLIEGDRVSFLMFDFGARVTGLALMVDGKVVHEVRGRGAHKIRPISWDLREFRGREAVLVMTDLAPDADIWIGIDEVFVSDG